MASSDDFREQLKAGNITEALALALSKAVELKVTTWVASGTDDAEAAEAKPGHRLRTHLNHLEGKIENEIGDQFIGNGPYRELRQFHLDQIAEGNKIIQNNLKSLHKLFEVWVAMRYQSATPPVIEPESLGVESQLLPPTEDIAEAGLGLAPPESGVGGFIVSPNTVIQEDVAQEPPLPSGEPSSLLTTPADTEEALDSETDDDDWDDSILDLLESLPVGSPPSPEALDSQIDEDWGDFIEEEPGFDPAASEAQGNQDWEILTLEDLEPRPAEAEPNIEASTSEIDEDFGDLIEQELDLDPVTSEAQENEDWGTLTLEDLESLPVSDKPNIKASTSEIDEDFGEFIEQELDLDPVASDSEENQDRGILTQQQLESPPVSPQPNIEASTSEIDEDFGEFIEQELDLDPVASDSQENQDRGILTQQQLESPPVSPQPNIEASTSEIDEDFGEFIEQELDLDPVASDSQENEDGEILTQQELEPRPSEAEPKIEASTSEIDDDWGWEDLIEEESDFELAVSDLRNQDRGILTQQELEPRPAEAEPTTKASMSEIDEDWGDFIEEEPDFEPTASDLQSSQDRGILTQQQLESPSAEAEPNIEASISEIDEDWGDFIEEEPDFEPTPSDLQSSQDEEILTQQQLESPSAEAEPNIEASTSEIDEDWGDFIEEEPDFEPTASDLQSSQDEEILTQQQLESPSAEAEPTIKASTSEIDEGWGDLIEQKPETEPDKPVPSLASLDLEEDDEWDDWVVEEPSLLVDEPLADMDSLDLGEDDDWDDFAVEANPFSVEPAINWSESDLEIDEDWDDFAAEELEPYSGVLDVDISFDQSDPLEDLNPRESALDPSDTPDLSKHLKRDSSTDKGSLEELDRSPQMPEMTNQSEEASNAPREVLWGETDQLSADPEPAIFDDGGVYDLEEGLFIQKPHKQLSAEAHGLAESEAPDVANASRARSQEDSERGVAAQESESLAMSADDLDAKPKPVERRVPPPPPPSRFPNQNN
jgi:hypothetical protein